MKVLSSSDNEGEEKPAPVKKKVFPRIRLSRFVKKKRKKLRFVCEECGKKFQSWWDIREHWLSTAHKAPDQCLWCKKKTFTLQSHLCKEHWNVATACPYCGQLFMYQEDHKRHLLSHDGTEYRCFMCGRRRKSEQLLRDHMLNHYLYEKYGCNLCEKRFKKKKNIEKHLISIHFVCQYCGKECENKEDLKIHIKIHDDLICLLCSKRFSQKNRLKYHYQLRHGHQEFYKCTLCFQRFSVKSSLINHMKLKHNGVSKYSCSVCAQPFLYWQQFVNHFERVHAKIPQDNKFACSSCDFVTDVKVKLQWHVEKTSGDGFFCKKCQIRFPCKGLFDKHMETHSAEDRLWTCDHCPRSYISDNSLRHHISMKHKDLMLLQNPRGYPCVHPGCDKYYASSSSLARHVRKSHNNETRSRSPSIVTSNSSPEPSESLTTVARQGNSSSELSESLTTVPRQGKKRIQHQAVLNVTPEQKNKHENSNTDEDDDSSSTSQDETEDKTAQSPTKKRLIDTETKEKFSDKKNDSEDEESVSSVLSNEETIVKIKRNITPSKRKVSSKLSIKSPEEIPKRKVYHHMVEEPSEITEVDVYSCYECGKVWFTEESFFKEHLENHEQVPWEDECFICNASLESPEDSVKHFSQEHLKVEFTHRSKVEDLC